MGLDPLSVIAPARVKVLLLPCGPITSTRFLSFVDRLTKEKVVRLGDVSPDGRPHRTMFSPLAFPAGSVLYDLATSAPLSSYSALHPFELYREPLVIIGVADGSSCCTRIEEPETLNGKRPSDRSDHEDTKSCHEMLLEGLASLKIAYPRALVHQVFIFEHVKVTAAFAEGITAVPSRQSSKTTTIKTIMCDLTAQLLGEMTTYARSLQALPTISTPTIALGRSIINGSGSLDASRPTSAARESRPSSPMKNEIKSQHRTSMPVTLPSDSSFSEVSQVQSRARSPPSRVATPAITFDEIAGPRRLASPSPKNGNDSRQQSKETHSMQGFGSGGIGERERMKGKGRVGVVVGALYLLAGRWPDAMKELVEGANISKFNSDYVWLAKAFDYILVTLLMYAWAGMDFKVPQILYPGIDKTNSSASKGSNHNSSHSMQDLSAVIPSRLVSMQNLTGLIPDLVNNVLNLYVRAWTFTDDKIPALAFSESAIRFCKLLTIIRLSHGVLDDEGLRQMVLNTRMSQEAPIDNPIPFPNKAEISTILFRAFPSPSPDDVLPVTDRSVILAGISSVLSDLGYGRKKALVLTELASVLLPALVQARKDGAAEMGVHPAASLVALGAAVGNAASHHSYSRFGDSDYGLRGFLTSICREYRIVIPAPPVLGNGGAQKHQDNDQMSSEWLSTSKAYDSDSGIITRIVEQALVSLCGAQQLKLDVLRVCINICEALPDLGGILRFSADTLRTAGSGIAPGQESDNGSPALPIDDQVRLANNISRTFSASQQLGLGALEAEYWDEFLVRGIELAEINPSKNPIPHAKAELDIAGTAQTQRAKNPLIYNPFGNKTASKALEPTLVAGEEIMFRVTLQNLYDFDLEIESIKLESDGIPFEPLPTNALLGPYRTQTMGLKGSAPNAGSLHITGCVVKIKGCRERRFPLFAEPWFLKMDAKTKPHDILTSTSSHKATASEPQTDTNDIKQYGPVTSSLRLSVLSSQPLVALKSVSLPQSAAMLLEGEAKTFTVKLQNLSPTVSADLLLISFQDSTALQLQSALSNKDLTLAELYELEILTTRNQPFRWLRTASEQEPIIEPGGTTTLSVEIFGRPGLSYGTMQIDFAHLGVPESEAPPQFYTRQLLIPFAVTVNASIDLVRNDIIPFTSDFAWRNQQRHSQPPSTTTSSSSTPETRIRPSISRRRSRDDNRFRSLLSRLGLHSQDQEHVLLFLDLRNSWPNLLTSSIQVRQINTTLNDQTSTSDAWKRAYTVHETQQPGHTSRLVLILPRLYVSNPHAPIPSLNQSTKRQYVVSALGDTSREAELAARETFWYREELLKHIRATWREDSTGRSGVINLRSLRLSTRMVSTLKLEDLAIRFTIHPAANPSSPTPSPTIDQTSLNSFTVPTSTFLTLRTHLSNRSSQPIHPLLRLQPLLRHQPHNVALDLSKKFILNGLLQRVLPVLEAQGTSEIDIGICVLSEGEYEVGASVEEVKSLDVGADRNRNDEKEAEDYALKGWTDGKGERRVWLVRPNAAFRPPPTRRSLASCLRIEARFESKTPSALSLHAAQGWWRVTNGVTKSGFISRVSQTLQSRPRAQRRALQIVYGHNIKPDALLFFLSNPPPDRDFFSFQQQHPKTRYDSHHAPSQPPSNLPLNYPPRPGDRPILPSPLHPQTNTFNSTYHLTPGQIAAANLSATLATDLTVALNFERSNWATGSVTTDPFYQPPSNTSTLPAGSLLKHETANTSLYTLPPLTALSRILYQTTTLNGTLVPASAAILFPYSPRHFPSANNSYPLVAWAHPFSGIFPECAPSHVRNIWYHFMAPFALAQAGYVVVAPDYQGLGVSHTSDGKPILHPSLAQPSHADDVFYAVQAAQSAYARLSKEFVIVGHSQGGGAAWAAAEPQARTPVEGYLGVVAGSPAIDFVGDVDALEAVGLGAYFLGATLVRGLQNAYPDFDIGSILTEEGVRRWKLVEEVQGCNPVFAELLADPEIYRPRWQHSPQVEAFYNANKIGGRKVAGPLLVVQGDADPVVPAVVIDGAVNRTCAMSPGAGIEYQRYKGAGHVPAMYAAQREWLGWVEERFEGKAVESGCVRREVESALPLQKYQGELNWFMEYALDGYETV